MANFHGLTVHGYGTHNKGLDTDYGMRVCGLLELGELGSASKQGHYETWEEFLQALDVTCNYSSLCGNLLFGVSSSQMDRARKYPEEDRFATFMLNHPNTKIIHAYKNNAHGPNCIFVCIHHRFPDAVGVVPCNDIEEWHKKHNFVGYEWVLT